MDTIASKLRRKLGEDTDHPRYIFTGAPRRLPHAQGHSARWEPV